MNKFSKKLFALTLAVVTLSSNAVFAHNFTDMPTDWTAPAVERAIENGLLSGVTSTTICPDKNITRAQMATIVTRCFKNTSGADISRFTDVSPEKWYYDAFSKAVEMGAFAGDNLNHLNPDKNITFQESFKVMACLFGLIANTNPDYTPNDLQSQDLTVLDKFADGASVANWAKPYVAAIVSNGYWDGIDGNLYPNQYITRAQFAVLMDNLVKTYIDEPGVYENLEEGNIMVRTNGVSINKDATKSSIIVAECVTDENPVEINIPDMDSLLVVRGGGEKVIFNGHVKKIAVVKAGIKLILNDTNIFAVTGYVAPGSSYYAGYIPQ